MDVVADDIDPSGTMAAVRKYFSESDYTLQPPQGCPLGSGVGIGDDRNFCSVTDQLSNVLLNHAMGSNRSRYDNLHRFTELLRNPSINNLQCWRYLVQEGLDYDSVGDLCFAAAPDSASDASVRILGAYGIACAKQRAGTWPGGIDYCADYEEQALAIFGDLLPGGTGHGEVRLVEGRYYLAGGYNNWSSAPDGTGDASFWPDYLELQFFADYARYSGAAVVQQAVVDLLENYRLSLDAGANHVHKGLRGRFDLSGSTPDFECIVSCDPEPYVDWPNTWRAFPALSGLLNVHPDLVPPSTRSEVFDYWWSTFAGGSTSFGPLDDKPVEIWWSSPSFVKEDDGQSGLSAAYVGLAMWIPLGAAERDGLYTAEAVRHLVEDEYDAALREFDGAVFFGDYASQFTQRAIGAATGMIDPAFWDPAHLQ